jgi:Xaa-Pro aminopeptidase
MSMNTGERVERLRRVISERGLDALLVTDIHNVRYLTGFTGSSAFALVGRSGAFFFTDFRYMEQSGYEVEGFDIRLERADRVSVIAGVAEKTGIRRLGFESNVTYDFYTNLLKLPLELEPQTKLVEEMRLVKDDREIACIKKAVKRAEEAFCATKPMIRPGVTERAVGLRLENELKARGCRRIPFDIIVASGRHSSLPHAGQTDKKLEGGDFVIIDWGGEADGYYSDMTRTLLIAGKGPDLDLKKKIYNIVNRARERAIAAVKPGAGAAEVDAAARAFISGQGFGEYFGHGTGHGVGLEVHEGPRVSWSGGKTIADGMVFSIEPGIYIPETGGVRIEDLALVVGGRGRTLTTLSRRLEVVGA